MFFTNGEPDLTSSETQLFVYSSEHHRGNAAFVTINIEGETGKDIAEYFSVD
jgi:protein disulfide-isomerase A1